MTADVAPASEQACIIGTAAGKLLEIVRESRRKVQIGCINADALIEEHSRSIGETSPITMLIEMLSRRDRFL